MHNLTHQQTSIWGETESKQILEMLWEQEKSNICTNYKTATFHKPPKGRNKLRPLPSRGVVCISGGSTSVLKKFHLSWPYSGAEYVWSHFRLEILSCPHFKRKENGKGFLEQKTNAFKLNKYLLFDITLKISDCLPFILGLAIRKHEQDWPFLSLGWLDHDLKQL